MKSWHTNKTLNKCSFISIALCVCDHICVLFGQSSFCQQQQKKNDSC